jgi:hypothetical protein
MKLDPPIKIDIDDLFKYCVVAFFVDKPDFLGVIREARKDLGIKKLLTREETEHLHLGFVTKKDNPTKKYKWPRRGSDKYKFLKKCNNMLANLYQIYQADWYFQDVIVFSILSGVVNENDLDTRPYFLNRRDFHEDEGYNNIGEGIGAIVIYPHTSDKEVADVLHKFRKGLKIPDTITNIKRDRKWLWLKVGGLSYSEIQKLATTEGEPITRDGVIKAIKQYEKRLTVDI